MAVSDVLFDLDGTLVDSAPAIVASLEHALSALGVESPGPDALRAVMGPPMREAFHEAFGFDEATTERAIVAYREHFGAHGAAACSLFDGVGALLGDLEAAGARLAIATSKPEASAARILEHLGVLDRFSAVCGADLDGRRAAKPDIVRDALRELRARPAPGVVMVGDREHDVAGARANGIRCVGAGWGYAAPGELERAGASPVVGSVAALRAELLGP